MAIIFTDTNLKMEQLRISILVLICSVVALILVLTTYFLIRKNNYKKGKDTYKKKDTIFLILSNLFFVGVVVSSICTIVLYENFKQMSMIVLSNDNTFVTADCDLGALCPGEQKKQEFTVKSDIDSDTNCIISFEKTEDNEAYDYLNIDVIFGDIKINTKTFSSLLGNIVVNSQIKKYESKQLIFIYSLPSEIPESIIGNSLDFKIVFETKTPIF